MATLDERYYNRLRRTYRVAVRDWILAYNATPDKTDIFSDQPFVAATERLELVLSIVANSSIDPDSAEAPEAVSRQVSDAASDQDTAEWEASDPA